MDSKACMVCGRIFPVEEFPVNKTLGSILGKCKDCLAAYHAAYREKHREKLRLGAIAYRERDREEINARNRASAATPEGKARLKRNAKKAYEKHTERMGIDPIYRAEFLSKAKIRVRRYYRNHRDEILAKLLAERRLDPETFRRKTRESLARWRKANPEDARVWNAFRSAKVRAGRKTGFIEADIYTALFKEQQGKCAYCDVDIADYFELEHMIPLKRGGLHAPENVVLVCKGCNGSKLHRILWSEWMPPKFRKAQGPEFPQAPV